ncbi:hypothetical protein F4814DRAFT_52383 [Daldinia grandis]|nr:hypothetical protein F4814DRAFT_52383 [Daldinia grandis]
MSGRGEADMKYDVAMAIIVAIVESNRNTMPRIQLRWEDVAEMMNNGRDYALRDDDVRQYFQDVLYPDFLERFGLSVGPISLHGPSGLADSGYSTVPAASGYTAVGRTIPNPAIFGSSIIRDTVPGRTVPSHTLSGSPIPRLPAHYTTPGSSTIRYNLPSIFGNSPSPNPWQGQRRYQAITSAADAASEDKEILPLSIEATRKRKATDEPSDLATVAKKARRGPGGDDDDAGAAGGLGSSRF